MSLIEKIDAMIKECSLPSGCSCLTDTINSEKRKLLREVKQLILSEQKEPCGFCKNSKSITYHGATEKLIDGTAITIKGDVVAICCPMCGRPLNQPSTE